MLQELDEFKAHTTVLVTTRPTDFERFPTRFVSMFRRCGETELTLSLPRLWAMATLTIVFNLRLVSDLLIVS